jgi:hypothetical protein
MTLKSALIRLKLNCIWVARRKFVAMKGIVSKITYGGKCLRSSYFIKGNIQHRFIGTSMTMRLKFISKNSHFMAYTVIEFQGKREACHHKLEKYATTKLYKRLKARIFLSAWLTALTRWQKKSLTTPSIFIHGIMPKILPGSTNEIDQETLFQSGFTVVLKS